MCNRYRMTARDFDVARARNIALAFDEAPTSRRPGSSEKNRSILTDGGRIW